MVLGGFHMELWKDIEGFEGIYQISNKGRVKSLARQCGTCYKKEFIRKLSFTKDGYVKIRLIGNGKDITTRVHRLVAKAFIPNPLNKETVNHIDGNKHNNCVENLEWMDRKEQLHHAYKNDLRKAKTGALNVQAKLDSEQVEHIRSIYKKGDKKYGSVSLGKIYNVSHRTILNIVNSKTYRKQD